MAMFSTPKQAHLMMQPSTLLTPPFSSSKPLFYSPIMRMQFSPALPLPFPSPPVTPTSDQWSPTPPEQKDIPSELYFGGYPIVAERVFSYLTGTDLSICLQVCRTWNQQVSSNSHFMIQVKSYRRQCKENAENLYNHQSEEPLVTSLQRRPLTSILPNKRAPVCSKPVPPEVDFSLCCLHVGECSPKWSRESEAICGTKKSKKRLRRL